MVHTLEQLRDEYRRLFADSEWVVSLACGAVAVFIAYTLNYASGRLATDLAGAPLSDFLLDALPRIDTGLIHEAGSQYLIGLGLLLAFFVPRMMPFMLAGVAAIVTTRAAFLNMTHLGLYYDAVRISGSYVTFGGDLFFSGHVAIPTMLGLIFWHYPYARYVFFITAVTLGTSSILGHYHYSIDVFAAPFIAHGVYTFLRRCMPQRVVVGFPVQ